MKQRIIYFDLAKALAMVMVCTCHCYSLVGFNGSVVNNFINSVTMPLFMMICGFFSIGYLRRDFKDFIASRVMRLLLPVFTCWLTVSTLTLICGGGLDAVLADALGGLWFLKSLFVVCIVAWIALRLPLPEWISALLTIVALLFVPHGTVWQVNYLMFAFWAGYFLRKAHDCGTVDYRWMFAVSAMIYVTCGILGGIHYQRDLSLWLMSHFPWVAVLQVVTALSGSLLLLSLCYYVGQMVPAVSVVAETGKYTLGIYVVQTIVLQYIMPIIVGGKLTLSSPMADFVVVPIMGAVATAIFYAITRLIVTCRPLSRWFFSINY